MFFDLPYGAKVDKYLAGMSTTQWLTWTNPRNEYSNAIILAAGGGSSGANGLVNGNAGTGGSSGSFGHIYCPLSLLPDTLYIQAGAGGLGGGASSNAGGATYISIHPNNNIANLLILCNGSGGSATIYNTLGIGQAYNGNGGSAGSISTFTNSGSSLPTTGNPIYGGTGGGYNGSSSGGMISVSSLYPSVLGAATGGNRGANGFVIQKPFTVFGGVGGGGLGGLGGNGIMGSGGGGGGGYASAGAGGNGGDGFVIIICY
jgi:hypothetical protein